MQGTRVEALRLYRDIVRTCRRFTWANEKGESWLVSCYSYAVKCALREVMHCCIVLHCAALGRRYVLQHNARKEFEEARHERVRCVVAASR